MLVQSSIVRSDEPARPAPPRDGNAVGLPIRSWFDSRNLLLPEPIRDAAAVVEAIRRSGARQR
jgi:hypothetical protein